MMNRKALAAGLAVFCLTLNTGHCEDGKAVERKISSIIDRMTLDEKVKLIAGNDMETYAIERVGIPQLKMCDGPVGVRYGQATAFPSSVCMAATWDPEMVYRISEAMAEEAKAKGRNMLLAPCVNIHRVPQGGRNFESFGEDPYLASRMAVAYVKGVQDQGVIATVKHYACNNQEWERGTIDVIVDERALREIYLPAFEAAIKEGGSWSIMAAYNKVNGRYCTENDHLVNEILKKEWGFKGFMVSDWGATHSTVDAAKYGLDLEMPRGNFFNNRLAEAVKRGEVKEAVIDDKARRILRAMFWLGLFDARRPADNGSLDTPRHRRVALDSAREGIVLLKNSGGILPIDANKTRSIAIIGPNAAVNRYGGGGSSQVGPIYTVSPLDALKEKVGKRSVINYSMGCKLEGDVIPMESGLVYTISSGKKVNGFLGEYFDNIGLRGEPVLRRVDKQIAFDWQEGSPSGNVSKDNFSARWTAKLVPPKTGEYELSLLSDDGSRLYINGKCLIDNWGDHGEEVKSAEAVLEAGKEYDLRVEYYEHSGLAVMKLGWDARGEMMEEAVAAAKKSDIAVIFVGLSRKFESEGFDRKDMDLPSPQNELIRKVAEANKNTVVVLNTGAPVLVNEWIDSVQALVEMWYPGQEGGNAIADILLGNYNPSGKLPMTFPARWEDCSAYSTYPGRDGKTYYSDGIFVGYRHFDKEGTKVIFPFGYGLSYTSFEYSGLSITPGVVPDSDIRAEVSFDLKNTGKIEGAEVAQLYIRSPGAGVKRPVKELKGFRRVSLRPGETKKVTFKLDKRSLAFYDADKKDWVAEPGEFEVIIASSSRDAKLKGVFMLQRGKLI